MVDIAEIKKVDYRLTWLIGHRNMFNIAVMFLSFWIIGTTMDLPDPVFTVRMAAALILFILGAKWSLYQWWDNLDASAWLWGKNSGKIDAGKKES
jgi:hypothetical protein